MAARWLLPGLALAQAAGILIADRLWRTDEVGVAASAARLAGWGALGLAVWMRGPARRASAVALAAGLLGLAGHGTRLAGADGAPEASWTSTFEAVVVGPAGRDALALRDLHEASGRIRLPRRALLALDPDSPLRDAAPGERWRIHGVLRPPGGLRNPGGGDRARAARRRGFGARLRLTHPGLAVRVGCDGVGLRARRFAWRRERVREVVAAGPGGGLLAALALGERRALGERVRDDFARLGLAHLLAVSGLHLTLVAAMSFAAARRLLARSTHLAARHDVPRAALAAGLVAAAGYALLTGPAIPVQRAFVLLAAAALGLWVRRPRRRLHPLALASLAILAREPAALFEPGFQLSFAATAALLAAPVSDPAASPSLRSLRSPRSRRLAGFLDAAATPSARVAALLRVSAAAILATAPLSAWHFGRVTPVGLLANLVAIPATALVLLPAAFAAALASVAGPTGVLAVAERLAAAFLAAVSAASRALPDAGATPPPSLPTLLLAGGIGVLALGRVGVAPRALGVVLQAALLTLRPPAGIEPAAPRAVFFDVGQGDATLVQGRRGTLLVDAGTALPTGFDAGRHAVLPALRALGVARLDRVVASHADLDHRGGLPAVIEALPVGAVWLPPGGLSDPAFGAVRAAAARRGVPVQERGAGDPDETLGDVRVAFLWPPREARLAGNDGSLVLRVEAAGMRVLLPGDIEREAEQELLSRAGALRADLLKLAHHGSATSSSDAWLRASAPSLAIASAPCRGRFGMPHAAVRARLADAAVDLAWTGRDGALIVGLGPRPRLRPWGTARRRCAEPPRIRSSVAGPPVFPGENR